MRKEELELKYIQKFGQKPTNFIENGGRFELLGNHTDHNHGLCIAATCDLVIEASVSKRNDNKVNIYSLGVCEFELSLNSLDVQENEKFSSQGLVRGVASYLASNGYNIGGFTAYIESNILPGAGVSSSAAFELLIGKIFNTLFNDGKIDNLLLAKAGQFAENKYFGKNSGLLDQIGVSYGGVSFIDFGDINNPVVNNLNVDFTGYKFVIVDTGKSHADLSDTYSSIPRDMHNAAHKLGVGFLRETSLDVLKSHKADFSHDEYYRSKHFFLENERVLKGYHALSKNDIPTFLSCMNASQESSCELLGNGMVNNQYEGSLKEACNFAQEIMHGEGAAKINGGGFAGSVICVIPDKYYEEFLEKTKTKYGEEHVFPVNVKTY